MMIFRFFCLGLLLSLAPLFSKDPFYYFVPPQKWLVVDPAKLGKSVQIGFVANSKRPIKPSLNLATESASVSLSDYINAVKKQHTANKKNRWSEIGYIETKAGPAHLSQIDIKSECGNLRSLQCILIKNSTAYIMTAVAPKDEFLDYHNSFLKAFESFTVYTDINSSLSSKEEKESYHAELDKLKKEWNVFLSTRAKNIPAETLFLDKRFQKDAWKDFEKFLQNRFESKGLFWQVMAVKDARNELLDSLRS